MATSLGQTISFLLEFMGSKPDMMVFGQDLLQRIFTTLHKLVEVRDGPLDDSFFNFSLNLGNDAEGPRLLAGILERELDLPGTFACCQRPT